MKTVAELLRPSPRGAVIAVQPEDAVLEAIKILAAENIGAAVVMTGDRLAGIFSERDYTRKVILKGRSSDTTRVEEIMTAERGRGEPAHQHARVHGAHDREEHPPPARGRRGPRRSAWSRSATS